jgi:hypothetical protein
MEELLHRIDALQHRVDELEGRERQQIWSCAWRRDRDGKAA